MTGLGPSGTDDNAVLGGLYFKGNRISLVSSCNESSSAIVQPIAANDTAGVINIVQCREFSTAAEGVYTCIIMNSSMMNQSIRFGVYFTGRSELLDLYVPSPS